MSEIEYRKLDSRRVSSTVFNVYVDGKKAGAIKTYAGGFAYKPINGQRGELFKTVREVQRSLEPEDQR